MTPKIQAIRKIQIINIIPSHLNGCDKISSDNSTTSLVGVQICTTTWKSVWHYRVQLNIYVPYDLVILHLGIDSIEIYT